MSEFVNNGPRCRAQHSTFDVRASQTVGIQYDWQHLYEAFCVCRNCGRGTIFLLKDGSIDAAKYFKGHGLAESAGSINSLVRIEGFVSIKDNSPVVPPDHLPTDILHWEFPTCTSTAGAHFLAPTDATMPSR